jgi:hypothetical protein
MYSATIVIIYIAERLPYLLKDIPTLLLLTEEYTLATLRTMYASRKQMAIKCEMDGR